MIYYLSTDILRTIIQEYLQPIESKNFISICKLFNKIDYLKYLNNIEGEICNFSILFAKHFRSLKFIYLRFVSDPCPWMDSGSWPIQVSFYRCQIKYLPGSKTYYQHRRIIHSKIMMEIVLDSNIKLK